MTRIGILGGSFDPPHNAHIAMARAALKGIPLDKVLFMPAPHPPHKGAAAVSPYPLRVRMVELAIEGEAGMELSRLEEFRDGPSFTVDLLRHYRRRSRDELFLIVGADSVSELPTWREPEEILKLATLVIFPRPGHAPAVPVEGEASVVLFEEPVLDISSTDIRARVRNGQSVASDVPKAIHKFILDNSLYS